MVATLDPVVGSPDLADNTLLESLPREVGVLLIVAGIGGILLPGPVGSPLVVLGGVVLFPKALRRVDEGMRARFPGSYRQGMAQVRRFVGDLERRYPTPKPD